MTSSKNNLAATLSGSLVDRLLAALDVAGFCEADDLRLIPRTGPAIVMANHPHGILDGLLLSSLLHGLRSDVKIVANSIFDSLPGYSEQVIAVDVLRSAKAEGRRALREAIRWLEAGGLLAAFPAGAVSRFRWSRMRVVDLPSWWRNVSPAIELGRSFIRLEHQRNYGALLALWRGIGAFLEKPPQYRYLFGPVSISGRYKAASKQLIESYLRPQPDRLVAPGVIAHTPPRSDSKLKRAVECQPLHVLRLDDIDAMIKDIEPNRCGLPVLLRHYVNLGGRILAFNEDAHFSSAVDGLLLIDLLESDVRRLDKFLGKGVIAKIAAAAHKPHVAA